MLAGAGFIGGLIADGVGLADTNHNIDWTRILIQLICAVVAVAAISAWQGNKSRV